MGAWPLGKGQVPADRASVAIWRRRGIPEARIALLGRDDNWWGPAGNTGPCGPDTKIFTWVGGSPPPEALDVRDRRWVAIVGTIRDEVGRFSREFCGGPHVASLDELRGRRFQIVREQAIAAGIRRIKAVLV